MTRRFKCEACGHEFDHTLSVQVSRPDGNRIQPGRQIIADYEIECPSCHDKIKVPVNVTT